MKFAFYKGMGEGGTWKKKLIHKGIARVSKPHTHVELVFTDGMSFSSEFGVGPRLKEIGYSHPERWTFVDIKASVKQESVIRYQAELLNNLREAGKLAYDTRGAVGCAVTGVDRPWKYFCSEAVYEVLCSGLHFPAKLNYKMYPQRLYEMSLLL